VAVGARIPVQAECEERAGQAGYSDAQIQNDHLHQRLFLACEAEQTHRRNIRLTFQGINTPRVAEKTYNSHSNETEEKKNKICSRLFPLLVWHSGLFG